MNLKKFKNLKIFEVYSSQTESPLKEEVDLLVGSVLYLLKICGKKNSKIWEDRFRNKV